MALKTIISKVQCLQIGRQFILKNITNQLTRWIFILLILIKSPTQ